MYFILGDIHQGSGMPRTTSLRHFAFFFPWIFDLALFTLGEAKDRCLTRTRQFTPGVSTAPHELHKESDTHSGSRGPFPAHQKKTTNTAPREIETHSRGYHKEHPLGPA